MSDDIIDLTLTPYYCCVCGSRCEVGDAQLEKSSICSRCTHEARDAGRNAHGVLPIGEAEFWGRRDEDVVLDLHLRIRKRIGGPRW